MWVGIPRPPSMEDELLKDVAKQAFRRAVIREGMENNTALEFCEGDVHAAAEQLGIDLVEEVRKFHKDLKDQQVNDVMDKADQDDDGQYVDLEDLIARHPAM